MSTEEQNVTPWTATSQCGFDYLKLIDKFGCSPIDGNLISRFERVTGYQAHFLLRRGVFFSHKDLNLCLDDFEARRPIFLYTGRGPSSDMHIGHVIPFELTAFLQKCFRCVVIVQLSDDEKYYFKSGKPLSYYNGLARDNAKHIIATGFDPERTFIFSNLETVGGDFYRIVVEIMKRTTGNQIRGTYGLDLNNNMGELSWPCFQAAPAFSQAFPDVIGRLPVRCLVAMAIDQAPYFRMARDFADRVDGFIKPAEIHTKFLVGLGGINDKMSSTGDSTDMTVYLHDTKEQVFGKIKKNAFSGGKATKAEHQLYGADLSVDVPYQYILHFMDDDVELERIANAYRNGDMMTSQIKELASGVVWNFIEKHQAKVASLTDADVDKFFDRNKFSTLDRNLTKPEPFVGTGDYTKFGFNFDQYFGSATKVVEN